MSSLYMITAFVCLTAGVSLTLNRRFVLGVSLIGMAGLLFIAVFTGQR